MSEGANVAQVLHCYAKNAAPVVFDNFDQAEFFELSEGSGGDNPIFFTINRSNLC